MLDIKNIANVVEAAAKEVADDKDNKNKTDLTGKITDALGENLGKQLSQNALLADAIKALPKNTDIKADDILALLNGKGENKNLAGLQELYKLITTNDKYKTALADIAEKIKPLCKK